VIEQAMATDRVLAEQDGIALRLGQTQVCEP
jgi:hypothetical protein